MFEEWDTEKYLNSPRMIFENYKQALKIIREGTFELSLAQGSLGFTTDDVDKFLAEERAFLHRALRLSDDDVINARKADYVISLKKFARTQYVLSLVSNRSSPLIL